MEIKTLNDIYTVTCSLDRPAALKYKRDGKWVDTSVDEFRDTIRYFATGLRLLGIKAGDRVAILSENRPESLRMYSICQPRSVG
jgi:long-subunit acyl-CoA synthetase (AMP-forming)